MAGRQPPRCRRLPTVRYLSPVPPLTSPILDLTSKQTQCNKIRRAALSRPVLRRLQPVSGLSLGPPPPGSLRPSSVVTRPRPTPPCGLPRQPRFWVPEPQKEKGSACPAHSMWSHLLGSDRSLTQPRGPRLLTVGGEAPFTAFCSPHSG